MFKAYRHRRAVARRLRALVAMDQLRARERRVREARQANDAMWRGR